MREDQVRGIIFEIITLRIVLDSGYKLIDIEDIDGHKYRKRRKRFVEIQGRGTWHQIDIPCDSLFNPSFIYPIRLFGEVKFYSASSNNRSGRISKELIREFIGVKEDITQNFFVASRKNVSIKEKRWRRTEVFAYFSANGFDAEAEKLAYAHGIKTISYENQPLLKALKEKTEEYAKHLVNSYSDRSIESIIDDLYDALILGRQDIRTSRRLPIEGFSSDVCSIKTSLIATTASGFTVHILSEHPFPDGMFTDSDEAYISIFSNDGEWYFVFRSNYIAQTEGRIAARYYFSMPNEVLEDKIVIGNKIVYPRKAEVFGELNISRMIKGIERSIKLKFDLDRFIDILKEI